ncbi:hypothetical protein [Auritidibacter ignavus]|uniref:hypothetical protein n=1 Tax=Auritidibacter ignavus TaxID=678932 RepID=UPI0021047424|nr:hypothetical protein [Auritidibacter ignavus]
MLIQSQQVGADGFLGPFGDQINGTVPIKIRVFEFFALIGVPPSLVASQLGNNFQRAFRSTEDR